jgi:prolyl oligopeptidase
MTSVEKSVLIVLIAVCVCCGYRVSVADEPASKGTREYPKSRVDRVSEVLHGVRIDDPYRWLEDNDAPEVHAWVESQNEYSRTILNAVRQRATIQTRLADLLSVGSISAPAQRGNRYFYSKREGKQNQPLLYVRDGVGGADRILVDPNTLSQDGTTALDWWSPSRDGKRVAFGTSSGGSEQSVLRLIDVDRGVLLPDSIPNTRACSVAWKPDGSAFFYTRYPMAGTVPAGEENYHRHVFFHVIGTDPSKDPEVFGAGRKPQDWPNVDISPNGRWLFVIVEQGWSKSEVYLRDLEKPESPFVAVAEGIEALFSVDTLDDRFFIHTNDGAPRYRVFSVDPTRPARQNWREVIAEREGVLQSASVIAGRLVCVYMLDASSRVVDFSLDGGDERPVELPAMGTVFGLGGEHDGREVFVGFHSFAIPQTVYRMDLGTRPNERSLELWQKAAAPAASVAFTVRQVRARSKDGTLVPMFVMHRDDLKIDGNRPTVLHGYGGFNVNQTPGYISSLPMWLEAGGVYCVANLRGGGEYGEDWHRAGMLANKQNVFDDFIASAEWLIENGYTSRERLAISGGSNGGLLVGAALTQRPDLYRAVVCRVPLLDMLRYHEFRIAKLWIPEYGSAEDPDQFQWLHAYSPYHRVQEGVPYPAVLLTTAESDSRVDPMHALKMAARLQATSSADHPILLRVESKAGHGAGKPLSKTIDEQTDIWSFLAWQLGVEL